MVSEGHSPGKEQGHTPMVTRTRPLSLYGVLQVDGAALGEPAAERVPDRRRALT